MTEMELRREHHSIFSLLLGMVFIDTFNRQKGAAVCSGAADWGQNPRKGTYPSFQNMHMWLKIRFGEIQFLGVGRITPAPPHPLRSGCLLLCSSPQGARVARKEHALSWRTHRTGAKLPQLEIWWHNVPVNLRPFVACGTVTQQTELYDW